MILELFQKPPMAFWATGLSRTSAGTIRMFTRKDPKSRASIWIARYLPDITEQSLEKGGLFCFVGVRLCVCVCVVCLLRLFVCLFACLLVCLLSCLFVCLFVWFLLACLFVPVCLLFGHPNTKCKLFIWGFRDILIWLVETAIAWTLQEASMLMARKDDGASFE